VPRSGSPVAPFLVASFRFGDSEMQASWGQEKNAPKPCRGGQLYGEVGRYKISTLESIPGIYTGAEDPSKRWGKPQKKQMKVTAQSTKRPPEMDIAPAGVKQTIGQRPNTMTMADHDHGVVWPPTDPNHKSNVAFMSMVKEPALYKNEVNGVMAGYSGHVPRARDKVGACPLGGVPGRPAAQNMSKLDPKGLVQSSKQVQGVPEPLLYRSEGHDPQTKSIFTKPKNPVGNKGVMPGYAGHVHRARYTVGLSPFETEDTKMKQYEYMDWESDEWGDGDLSDMDIKLQQEGYSGPGGNNEDAYVPSYFAAGYQNNSAGSGGEDQNFAAWERNKLGL